MRLHALQYLRAVAALAVVYSHAASLPPEHVALLPQGGVLGVDIFFVISGFIMVWIARPDDTPARFLANRICRIVPLYWFFTLLMAVILLAAPWVFRNSVFDGASLATSLLFVPYPSIAHPAEVWPLLAPGWSLNYEMYFYLLFAMSLLLAARGRVAAIAVSILTLFLVAHAIDSGTAIVQFLRESIVFEFVLGMGLALAYRKGLRLSSASGAALLVGGIALFAIDPDLPHIFRFGVPALLVVAGCLYLKLPELRWAVLLGDASYALYLSHLFVLGALRRVLPPVLEPVFGSGTASAAWAFVVVALVICLAVSVVVHLAIDGWLLRRERIEDLRRLAGAGRGAAELPVTSKRSQ